MEKSGGRKSRATVPLSYELTNGVVPWIWEMRVNLGDRDRVLLVTFKNDESKYQRDVRSI